MSPQEPNPAREAATKPTDEKSPIGPNGLSMILPHVPLMLRVALFHILRRSEQSKYVDLRTELIVAVLRAYMNPSQPQSITSIQKMDLFGAAGPPKGRIWVSTYRCPPPPAGDRVLQDAITKAIDGMWNPKTPKAAYQLPDPEPIEGEWTGYRPCATSDSPLPELSQRELYTEMMKDVKSPVTILYFHGGAYCSLDPATHRPTVKKLAKLTGGRVYNVRYRLAPQHPFPAALMDALMSYLALLYPPEGAFHEPVKPEHIVFAGDSAGGNLALALLQLILHLSRANHVIPLPDGSHRPIPLPGGVAVNSPWLDVTHSSPSCTANAAFDYLPTPAQQHEAALKRPRCAAWPADPPRKNIYVADALVSHPLVTLLLAPSWRGAPPVYLCTGWELLADEDRHAARCMWRDGVRVVFEEYEAMPHCFGLALPYLKETRRCLDAWAGFIKSVAESGPQGVADEGGSRFVRIRAKTLEEERIEPAELCAEDEQAVEERFLRNMNGGLSTDVGIAKL